MTLGLLDNTNLREPIFPPFHPKAKNYINSTQPSSLIGILGGKGRTIDFSHILPIIQYKDRVMRNCIFNHTQAASTFLFCGIYFRQPILFRVVE